MSSSLERLVPVLDGMNYRDWAVLMQLYLQLQDLWEVVDGSHRMPAALAAGATASETTIYNDAYVKWNVADNKATGVITLRISASLRHYHSANQSARTFWENLKTAFGAASMPAVYVDFKQVINTKLSGGNPVPKMERMATLFGCLVTNSLTIIASLQGLILLAALPNKWDNVAQLFMQRTDLTTSLTFSNVRTAIKQEYECAGRPANSSARKLSAVKRKGPVPVRGHSVPPSAYPQTHSCKSS